MEDDIEVINLWNILSRTLILVSMFGISTSDSSFINER